MKLSRTVSEIKQEYRLRSASPFDFGTHDLLLALPFNDAKEFLRPDVTPEKWDQGLTLTREDVLATMRDYGEFAWSKVLGHRGISAGRNLDHYVSWCWLLGDDEAVAFMRDGANYPNYGAPALAYVCKKYEIPIPDSEEIRRMTTGKPCSKDCQMGCGR